MATSTFTQRVRSFVVFDRGALRSQKPRGLLGTGKEWGREPFVGR